MKHLKIVGLAVVVAAAFMALAGSASANVLTKEPGVNLATGTTITSTAGSSLLLKAGFANITCTSSTVAGNVSSNTATSAGGAISTLSYSNCGSATVDTLANGSLEIKSGGEVRGSGSEVTTSVLGTSCVYGTGAGTKIGTATGSTSATSDASLTISASLPKISGGFACANPASWSGTYTVTSPTPLYID